MLFPAARLLACTALLSSSLLLSSWAAAPAKKDGPNSKYPGLLEATTEELDDGLEKGRFTSVDLVKVGFTTHGFFCP
jgi:hypothetical protein